MTTPTTEHDPATGTLTARADVLPELLGSAPEERELASARLSSGSSLLCEDESARRRMLDMERHMRPARIALFVVLALTLGGLAPWVGVWPLAPLGTAILGFLIADRIVPRSKRPEYCFMAAWGFAQLMIGLSIVLTGGPTSVFLPWLAIPAATLGARFNRRGVIAGCVWTAAIMVAGTMGVNAAAVADSPQRLVVPLTLLAGVAILSMGLMRSDVHHRAAAAIDPLTGLLNRHALARRAEELIEQARLTQTSLAVLIGDLDHFKAINDEHGHLVGDEVLCETADAMRLSLRTFDHVYRYGGEEFVVLLPGGTEAAAVATAERLREAVAVARPGGLPLTISFGVSAADGAHADLDNLLRAADHALYRAKTAGRDRVLVG